MKVMGKNSLSSIIKLGLQVIFILGTLVIIFLPWCLKWYLSFFSRNEGYYYAMLAILYTSGVLALFIIYKFILMFKTLKLNNPFVNENVRNLQHISFSCCIIAIIYFIAIFVFSSVFTAVIFMIFTIAFLGAYILAEVFRQAVEYKEENDLTI